MFLWNDVNNTDRTLHQILYTYSIYMAVNPLPDDKSSDWSKIRQITDDILKSQ